MHSTAVSQHCDPTIHFQILVKVTIRRPREANAHYARVLGRRNVVLDPPTRSLLKRKYLGDSREETGEKTDFFNEILEFLHNIFFSNCMNNYPCHCSFTDPLRTRPCHLQFFLDNGTMKGEFPTSPFRFVAIFLQFRFHIQNICVFMI